MRDAIYRLTAPILDRIPDISHQPQGRQVSIGLAASLVFHLLLLLVAVIFGMVLPEHGLLHFAKPKPQLEEIEIVIIPPVPVQEEVRLVPLEEIEKPKPFIDSRGLATTEKAPDKPLFESDVDMKAASERPATGDLPLPSQEGRVAPEFPVFADAQMSLGKTVAPFSQNTPPPPAPAAPPEPETAPPSPPAPEQAVAEKTMPPTPLKEVAAPAEDEIALAAKPAAPPRVMPRMRATLPVAMLTTPPPAARTKPGYQPQLQKTRIEGNISNRGRNSVDAMGTPLGRYKKAVNDAIGSRWYRYTAQKTTLIAPGSVRVSFSIDSKGRPVGVRSESNTSNASFADLCEQAIREADIAVPPPDLMEPLLDGKLDFTITFTFHTF